MSFGSKNCSAFGEVVNWELQLRILGANRLAGSHIGTILGPSLAILWVMLKLSRAMVGHAGAICQRLFGHVVGFVSQSALPQKHPDFKWVLASYVLSVWGSNARMEASFWAPICQVGHLRPL